MELREFPVTLVIKEFLLSLMRNVSFHLGPQNEDENLNRHLYGFKENVVDITILAMTYEHSKSDTFLK